MQQVVLAKIEYGVPLSLDDLLLLYEWGKEVIQAYDAIMEGIDEPIADPIPEPVLTR